MKHDYKLISRQAYIPQGEDVPSAGACIASAAAGVASTLVLAYAFIGFWMGF